jgi:hypothetical protein
LSLALKRDPGMIYPTVWLIHQKVMQTMAEREASYVLDGQVQVDNAYLEGMDPVGLPDLVHGLDPVNSL